jgi:hypothetical protein
MIKKVVSRHRISLNAWLALSADLLPMRFRDKRSIKLLRMSELAKKRVEKALDIRNVLHTQTDV